MARMGLKEELLLELIILIYQLSNDNKKDRLYYYKLTEHRFNRLMLDTAYLNRLIIDLNLYDVINANDKSVRTLEKESSINDKDKMLFDIKLHEVLSSIYYH